MKTLFVSVQHRPSPLFEKGMEIVKREFEVFILQNPHDNYDNGVVRLSELIRFVDWDIVHFVDNDCFISSMDYIRQTVKDFGESDLGFASYFENGWGNDYTKYPFKGKTIAEVTDQTWLTEYPFMKPSWENAMMMFKREAWDKVTDWSDMNKYLPELDRKGVKFGVMKVEPRLKYSHKGDGFFHVGNLMHYYYKMENNEPIEIDEVSKPRIGYLQKYHNLKGYPDFTKEWEDLIK